MTTKDGVAWSNGLDDLADFVLDRMVNRTDAYGVYGAKGVYTEKKKPLGKKAVLAHLRGERLIGLHSTSPESTCKWLALDVDCHDDDDGMRVANDEAVKRLYVSLQDDLGLSPLVIDSDGRGSFHVLILFESPVPVADCHALGEHIRKEYDVPNCELFPKQAKLPAKGFGNWLRLFGRHHSRVAHWGRAWTGAGYIDGDDFAGLLLANDGDLCPAVPGAPDAGVQPAVGVRDADRGDSRHEDRGRMELSAYTLRYRLDGASVGERNGTLFNAACDYEGTRRTKAECLDELGARARADGLADQEITQTIESAYSEHREPIGAGRPITDIDRLNAAGTHLRLADVDGSDDPESPGEATTRPETPRNRPRLTNYASAKDDEGTKIMLVRSVDTISQAISEITGGWPRRVAGQMFVPGTLPKGEVPGAGSVRYIKSADEVFAWVSQHADLLWIKQGTKNRQGRSCTPVTKAEIAAHLRDTASPSYAGVECLPHAPAVNGVYYLPINLPEATGECLAEFIARTNPATEEDRALLLAALVTPGWGGPPGTRPAFVFSSDHGRGVGKTATVTAFTEVWGGAISIGGSSKQDWEQAKARLLDESSLAQRCVVIDNIKGKFGVSSLESMLTSPRIDGKRMYVGQFSRPNLLTWFLTANVPRMSQDLSERSIIIKIGPANWSGNYVEDMQKFIEKNRLQLLADIYAWLGQPDQCDLRKCGALTRWTSWAYAILAKFTNGAELLQLISDRREPVDSDKDDVEELLAVLDADLTERGHKPDAEVISITRHEMLTIFETGRVLDGRLSIKRVGGYLRSLIGSGMLPNIVDYTDGKARYWIWRGVDASPDATTKYLKPAPGDVVGLPQTSDDDRVPF